MELRSYQDAKESKGSALHASPTPIVSLIGFTIFLRLKPYSSSLLYTKAGIQTLLCV